MDERFDKSLAEVLELCAPGEPLRDGLERIMRSGRGALVVLGDDETVLDLCSGGFAIDADCTPHRLAELAKMDGAIICDREGERIRRANVHLVPAADVPTSESGIRHRTAERTARQTGSPVIAVSESMRLVTVYVGEHRHILERTDALLVRANQALQTLERYRTRFDDQAAGLMGLEIEDVVTLRDVAAMLQRAEMAHRIAREVERFVLELGRDGRLVRMQLEELVAGLDEARALVVADYYAARRGRRPAAVLAALGGLGTTQVVDITEIARALGFPATHEALDTSLTPRGYRLLSRIPRVPQSVCDNIVRRFGSLPRIIRASLEELDEVEGVGEARARLIADGIRRLSESTML